MGESWYKIGGESWWLGGETSYRCIIANVCIHWSRHLVFVPSLHWDSPPFIPDVCKALSENQY